MHQVLLCAVGNDSGKQIYTTRQYRILVVAIPLEHGRNGKGTGHGRSIEMCRYQNNRYVLKAQMKRAGAAKPKVRDSKTTRLQHYVKT